MQIDFFPLDCAKYDGMRDKDGNLAVSRNAVMEAFPELKLNQVALLRADRELGIIYSKCLERC